MYTCYMVMHIPADSSLLHAGADPGGGLGGLQPPVLSPAPGKERGKRAQSRDQHAG